MLVVNVPTLTEMQKYQLEVAKIAKKYAKRNNWCSEVDRALKEMNIDPKIADPEKVKAKVSLRFDTEVVVNVDPNDFVGLTDADQLVKLSELVKNGTIKPAIDLKSAQVVAVTNATDTDSVSITLSDQYLFRFTSSEGRVRHIVPKNYEGLPSGYSLCQYYGAFSWSVTSPRDNGNICKDCESRYATMS